MKTIPLSRGLVACVDDADLDFLSRYSWYANDKGYAVTNVQVNGKKTVRRMHRMLLGVAEGKDVDHADRNRLNNCRANLRPCTRQDNLRNQCKRAGSSQYKGVYWMAANGKWRAKIGVDRKSLHLGLYDTEQEAALAYDRAALMHFGEFARTNSLATMEAHHAT